MKNPSKFYRVILLFQVYSGAVASLAVPPVLLALLGSYLHKEHAWHRGWIAVFVLLGIIIGIISTYSYLRKTETITTMRDVSERDGLFRISRDSSGKDSGRGDHKKL